MNATTSSTKSLPTAVAGRFGAYGGRYVPETLMAALEEFFRLAATRLKGAV